jgi:hypothetical protein
MSSRDGRGKKKDKGFNTEGTENTEFTEKRESPAKKWLNEREKRNGCGGV